jgi:hypothetical protein
MNPTKNNIKKTKIEQHEVHVVQSFSFLYIVFSVVHVVNREKTKIEQYEPR